MRAKRIKASKETVEFYGDMSEHLCEHFDRIIDTINKYNEKQIMDEMNSLTVCYWSGHFVNGNVRKGFTLEQDIDNFTNELRRLMLESIREANHFVEGNEERLH